MASSPFSTRKPRPSLGGRPSRARRPIGLHELLSGRLADASDLREFETPRLAVDGVEHREPGMRAQQVHRDPPPDLALLRPRREGQPPVDRLQDPEHLLIVHHVLSSCVRATSARLIDLKGTTMTGTTMPRRLGGALQERRNLPRRSRRRRRCGCIRGGAPRRKGGPLDDRLHGRVLAAALFADVRRARRDERRVRR
jgi:hypothetical protein